MNRTISPRYFGLVFVLAFLLGRDSWGQPYHLPLTPFSNLSGYTDGGSSIDLTTPTWAAANGYGNWTSNGVQWYLLGNELHDEQTSPPVSPSGVVAEGSLGYLPSGGDHDVKVVTNLQGKVRYIWPDETTGSPRDRFVIKGFNPANIQINFTGIPKTPNSAKVISGGINTYSSLLTGGKNVCDPTVEAGQWIDCYDAAMDTKYLYVVWERSYIVNTTRFYEIWAAAKNLSNDSVDFGPTRIDGGLTDHYDFDHAGRRPTIACDVRANPSSPNFDVAYINLIPDPGSSGSGSIVHIWVHGGVIETYTVDRKVLKHNTDPAVPDDYLTPVHVRMLVSSVPVVTTPVKAIYAIVYSPGNINQENGALILHRIINNTFPERPYAYYVDGQDSPPLIRNVDHEAPLHPLSGSSDVINQPIMGVANPYDGAADSTYDEFHCAYSLYTTDTSVHIPVTPLLMVRGYHNPIFAGVSPSILNRKCTNCDELPIPDSALRTWDWFGSGTSLPPKISVNQMGIHNLWVTKLPSISGLAYTRALREFDEDIEENTLVTDSCVVADGRWHGGTRGANLLSGKTMTFWTDPNFGVTSTNSGVYLAPAGTPAGWRNARIALIGDSVTLDISGTHLVALPNFEFRYTGAGQALNIHSTFDYYGLPKGTLNDGTGPVATCFIGTGAVNLMGGSVTAGLGAHDPPAAWSSPALMNIHGGSIFKLPETVNLVSTNSWINCNRENSIVPITNILGIAVDYGTAHFYGKATFSSSKVQVHVPLDSVANIFYFHNPLFGGTPVTAQLSSTNTLFQNIDTGYAGLKINGASSQTITGGKFDGVNINVPDSVKSLYISYPIFASIRTKAINLTLLDTGYSYDHRNIIGCRFTTFYAHAEAGVYAEGFEKQADLQKLWIESNDFTTNTGQTGSNGATAAIELINSCASVLRNTISGTGYKNGIINKSPSGVVTSNTFVCSNIISNCSDGSGQGTALSTTNWVGYSKLNEFFHNDIGHQSNDNDNCGVDFCHYHNNTGAGLKVVNASTSLDMSGVHHTNGDPDYAGWNTLDSNVRSGGSSGEVEVANHAAVLIIGTIDTVTTNWGHNTFVADGTTNNNILYGSGSSFSYQVRTNINYFGTGSLASPVQATWSPGIDTIVNFHNAHSYLACCGGQFRNSTTPYVIDFSVDCGGGFTSAHGKDEPKVQSVTDNSQNECDSLYNLGYGLKADGNYVDENTIFRQYIEQCAQQDGSFHQFTALDGAVQFMSDDNNRWLDYREWLKKVLYLSLDSLYYCQDANSIIHTFAYFVPGHGEDYNGLVSVIDYLLQNNRCPDSKAYFIEVRNYNRNKQVQLWQDSVKDPTKTPLDTSAITLDSLDLEILRGPQSAVASPSGILPSLEGIFVTENPFTQETSLETTLHEAKMLKLEIYDLIGKKFYEENKFFSEGKVKWIVPGNGLPHGTVYARISTIDGKVRTVKLIHE